MFLFYSLKTSISPKRTYLKKIYLLHRNAVTAVVLANIMRNSVMMETHQIQFSKRNWATCSKQFCSTLLSFSTVAKSSSIPRSAQHFVFHDSLSYLGSEKKFFFGCWLERLARPQLRVEAPTVDL